MEPSTAYPYDADAATRMWKWRNEYQNYVDAVTRNGDRERLLRNFDYYDGIDHGQWDKDVLAALQASGKPAHTYNWIQNIIDSTVGHLKQEPLGIKYLTPGTGSLESTGTFDKLYDMDYNRGNYQREIDRFVLNGLIHTGVLQMSWGTNDDRLGNVDITSVNPKHMIKDPYWNSTNIEDCRGVFMYSWMTADQIKTIYNTKSQEVDDLIEKYAYDTTQNNTPSADRSQPYYDEDGRLFKVIESYYTEERMERKVIDMALNTEINSFDLSKYKGHKHEILQNIITLTNPNWKLVVEPVTICKVFTFAPAISNDLILEEGDYGLQIGRLPFLFFSYKENYEKVQGLADKLIDPQDIFNKRQSMASHALGGAAGAGNWIVEKSVFNGDTDRLDDFEERISGNGEVFEVEDGSISDKKMQEVQRTQMPIDILRSSEDQRNYLNDLAMITPGMQGYSDQADESGKLYQSKVRQGLIGLELLSENIKYKLNELGEMYESAAVVIYSGPKRMFLDKKTNEEFWINRYIVDDKGEVIQSDVIADMPKQLVRIEEQRIGKSKRDSEIQMYTELLGQIQNPVIRASLETNIATNLDLNEETTQTMKDAGKSWMEAKAKEVQAMNAQFDMAIKQSEAASKPQPQVPQQGQPQVPLQ